MVMMHDAKSYQFGEKPHRPLAVDQAGSCDGGPVTDPDPAIPGLDPGGIGSVANSQDYCSLTKIVQ